MSSLLRFTLAIVVMIAAAVCLMACARQDQPSKARMKELVRSDIDRVMSDIDAATKEDPSIGLSSNPFDYVGISPAMQRLVDRGAAALEPIVEEIESSPDNGLREYLLAIAGRSIYRDKTAFSTGKEWAAGYRASETVESKP